MKKSSYIIKKVSIFIAILLIVPSVSVFADNAQTKNNTQINSFTLDQAIDYALKNRNDLLSNKADIMKNTTALEEAKSAYKDLNKEKQDEKVSFTAQNYAAKSGMGVKNCEFNLFKSQEDLKLIESSIKYNVESTFYTYLCMADKVKSAKENYDLAQQKFNNVQMKKNVGLASNMDISSVNMTLKQAQYDLDKMTSDMENSKYDFKKAIGLDLSKDIEIKGSLALPEKPKTKIDDAIALAKQNRYESVMAEATCKLNQDNLTSTALWYKPNTYKYQQVAYDVDASKYNYLKTQDSVEISLRKTYSDLDNAYAYLDVLDSNLDYAQKSYNTIQSKFEVGLATSTDVSDAFQKLANLKNSKSDAILNALMASRQYEYACSIGISSN